MHIFDVFKYGHVCGFENSSSVFQNEQLHLIKDIIYIVEHIELIKTFCLSF